MRGWTCIILGVTGDLSHRKLLPALYHVVGACDCTSDDIMICGAAYEETQFNDIWDSVASSLDDVSQERISWLKEQSWYQSLDFSSREGFEQFADEIAKQESQRGLPGRRMVYLAVPADMFCRITAHLVESGIVQSGSDVHRIVYEKPFGRDLESAQQINACINDHNLTTKQIYRVDHYLTKEFINNIVLLRFTNQLFEATWHADHIQRVEIICKEEITIAGRGQYYDRYGAIRDMLQSHMLQMLALTAMERPGMAVGSGMEGEKNHVLSHTEFVNGIRGQYDGYHTEPQVASDSTTETAVVAQFRVNTPRWEGVPWYMFTGKALDEKRTEIRIIYKSSVHNLFRKQQVCDADELVIQIAPQSGFVLQVNSKKPNSMREIMPVTLDFCHSCQYGPYTIEAYEALLMSVFAGEQSISVGQDEIETQWKLAEQTLQADMPLRTYKRGASGDQLRDAIRDKDIV